MMVLPRLLWQPLKNLRHWAQLSKKFHYQIKYAIPTYYIVAPCECSSNLSRMDGVRFGHRCTDPTDLEDLYLRSRTEGFGEEVKRRIMIGTYALSAGYYDAYYLKAQKTRHLISNDFKEALKKLMSLWVQLAQPPHLT
ncbi:Aspartyl-tRNA(Asn) amidotransferase subunit A (EC @ Glutamyl-tRNA(Gln) amidotransferase subunit A (EC [uncultured Gammaproteobacteria bacterium]|nr:Aspartyl-tRNA(Asn) amidotransferase subunit A (EC @ Glutamyl-tRNA(Gln) amidotransferase subunit A (EC [uncultured Gammaproteobacteria bacterium]